MKTFASVLLIAAIANAKKLPEKATDDAADVSDVNEW